MRVCHPKAVQHFVHDRDKVETARIGRTTTGPIPGVDIEDANAFVHFTRRVKVTKISIDIGIV